MLRAEASVEITTVFRDATSEWGKYTYESYSWSFFDKRRLGKIREFEIWILVTTVTNLGVRKTYYLNHIHSRSLIMKDLDKLRNSNSKFLRPFWLLTLSDEDNFLCSRCIQFIVLSSIPFLRGSPMVYITGIVILRALTWHHVKDDITNLRVQFSCVPISKAILPEFSLKFVRIVLYMML